jgi:hypothetical protein
MGVDERLMAPDILAEARVRRLGGTNAENYLD